VATATKKKLTVGSTVRIFRDGGVLHGPLLNVPDGKFTVRHLPAGSYVARDEDSNEVQFVVGVDNEEAVIVPGSLDVQEDAGSAEPGSSWTVPADALLDSTGMDDAEYPKSHGSADEPKHAPQADVPVLGEPGSAKITLTGEPYEPVLGGQDPDEGSPAARAKAREESGEPTSLDPDAVGAVPAGLEDSPAVVTAGDKKSHKDAGSGTGALIGEPPKSLEPDDAPPATDLEGRGKPGDPELYFESSPPPGRTEDVSVHAAAGPYAPMPDTSGDEPEEVPVVAGDEDSQLPQGKVRTARNTSAKRSAGKKSASKSSSKK
jgi:hypothetical protein